MIKIIDCGIGNTGSIGNMLLRLGGNFQIASKPEDLDGASLIILPGVGSFDNGAAKLCNQGFYDAIKKRIENPAVKLLGICLGMQLLFSESEEGELSGLDIIPGKVIRFQIKNPDIKIPHMGWNQAVQVRKDPLLDGAFDAARFYFVHSYHVTCGDEWIVCKTNHGYEFPSVVSRGNVYGAQFHPEKSHRFGLQLLRRFVEFDIGK